jgi:hypothetical protein
MTPRTPSINQQILTPQGNIPIADIREGQEVIGYDYETKQQEVYIVSKKGPFSKSKSWWRDGKAHFVSHKNQFWIKVNRKYSFAPHQSIYANGNVVHAFELKIGDVLEDINGKKIMVSRVERIKSEAPKYLLVIEKKKNFLKKTFADSVKRNRLLYKAFHKKIKEPHTYYIDGILAHNASRYWVGGSQTWDGTAGTKWAATDGGASGASVPTAADDVFFTASSSGTITTSGTTTDVCRSLNSTGFAGTLSHAAGTIITIGDATAGASNIALKLVAGMTYTLGNATTSEIDFVSTSATVQTVDFASKITGNVVLNASSNGSWQLTGTWGTSSVNGSQATTLTKGTLDTNGQTIHWGRFDFSSASNKAITLGASTINLYGTNGATRVWNGAATGVTFNANTSTISMKTALAGGLGAFTPVGLTYNNITVDAGGSNMDLGGGLTCANLTVTGSTNKTDNLVLSGSTIVTNTFTVNGNSSVNRILIRSSVFATQRSISAATVSTSNIDLQDISGIGAGSWNLSAITGNSGDCGGNSNITFTTGASQTWAGTSGGNWSANAWTSRVPLPQDDVVISSAFSASQTITNDMPRVGKSINWTGSSGSPVWSFGTVSTTMFGSLTLIAGMSITGANGMTFAALADATITSNGISSSTLNTAVNCRSGATISLADNWATANGVGNFQITAGGFNSNSFTINCNLFQTSGTLTRSITLGTSTINLTGTGAGNQWNIVAVTGLTFSGASSTIVYLRTSASTRVFAGGGLTYGTLTYTVAGSTGILQITGSNTFNTINFSDVTNARTLQFTAATTTIVANWNVFGTSGKLMTVNSITAASQATVKVTTTQNTSYVDAKDINSNVAGGIPINDSTGGVNSGNNDYWVFPGGVISVSDSGTGTEGSPSITTTVPLTDSGSGSDSPSVQATVPLSDSGSGTESAPSISAVVALDDYANRRYALSFDGLQNYLNLGQQSVLAGIPNGGTFYVGIDIQADPGTNAKAVYEKNVGGSPNKQAFGIDIFPTAGKTTMGMAIEIQNGGIFADYANYNIFADGQRHLVEFVWNFINNTKFIFVDGVFVPSGGGGSNGPPHWQGWDTDGVMGYTPAIGANNGPFKIFDFKLGQTSSNLSVHYDFTRNQGDSVADDTGNGWTATLQGSPKPEWVSMPFDRETVSISNTFTIADTGVGVEAVAIAATLAIADSGVGVDALDVANTFSLSDSGVGAESTPSIINTFTITDAGVGVDIVRVIDLFTRRRRPIIMKMKESKTYMKMKESRTYLK